MDYFRGCFPIVFDLLKQVRAHLIETARPILEATVLAATGVHVKNLHHDISTATGEEIVLFTLSQRLCVGN